MIDGFRFGSDILQMRRVGCVRFGVDITATPGGYVYIFLYCRGLTMS
jgi:hypothetical protein